MNAIVVAVRAQLNRHGTELSSQTAGDFIWRSMVYFIILWSLFSVGNYFFLAYQEFPATEDWATFSLALLVIIFGPLLWLALGLKFLTETNPPNIFAFGEWLFKKK